MRAISVIVGILISAPALLFFWVGSQTFLRLHERLLANLLMVVAGLLLALSIGLIFTPGVQRAHSVSLAVTILLLAGAFVLARAGR